MLGDHHSSSEEPQTYASGWQVQQSWGYSTGPRPCRRGPPKRPRAPTTLGSGVEGKAYNKLQSPLPQRRRPSRTGCGVINRCPNRTRRTEPELQAWRVNWTLPGSRTPSCGPQHLLQLSLAQDTVPVRAGSPPARHLPQLGGDRGSQGKKSAS